MALGAHQNTTTLTAPGAEQNYRGPLAMVTTLFFMWGFLTCLNDILVPHLKSIFDLNYAEVILVQFCFFSAYAIFSIPSGKVIERIGYQRMMVAGLLIMGARRPAVHSRRQRSVVSLVSGSAHHSGGRHHRSAGRCQSLRRGLGTGSHRVQSPESHAGLQLARHYCRTCFWRVAHPGRSRRAQDCRRATRHDARRSARLSPAGSVVGEAAVFLHCAWR